MLIFGITDVRYLRSDTADNQHLCPILRILCLLCLQCKAPFTMRRPMAPYFDSHIWTHSDVCPAELGLCRM